MCFQNRVDPFGTIIAHPARGLFMGNRGGKIHDPTTKALLKRRYASRQWIVCVTKFRGREREVMGNSYTELFFLDEITALSAGHRPCAECRRPDFNHYRAAITPNFGDLPKVDAIDGRLHGERLAGKMACDPVLSSQLPDGAMIAVGEQAYARRGDYALPWSFDGYGAPVKWRDLTSNNPVLLTPATNILALRNGYTPIWHRSGRA